MEPEMRAREGVFLSFQYPIEIPGVSTAYFLKTAVNAVRKHRGLSEMDAIDFLKAAREKAKIVGMDESFLNRSLNEGFSGGEKKRNEIFQMLMLEPTLVVLDETDSGLDVDALRTVAGRRQCAPLGRALDARHHALPAALELHRARSHPRARRRQDRPLRAAPSSRSRSRRKATWCDRGSTHDDYGGKRKPATSTAFETALVRRARRQRGAAWLEELRRAAIGTFDAIGFPGPKNEDWKYTGVTPIVDEPFFAALGEPRAAFDARSAGALRGLTRRFRRASQRSCSSNGAVRGRALASCKRRLRRGYRLRASLAADLAAADSLAAAHLGTQLRRQACTALPRSTSRSPTTAR